MARLKNFNPIGMTNVNPDPIQTLIQQIQQSATGGFGGGQQLGLNLLGLLSRQKLAGKREKRAEEATKRGKTREDLQRAQLALGGYKANRDAIQKQFFPQGVASLKQWEELYAKKDPQQFSAINKQYKDMLDYDIKIKKLLKKYSPVEQKQILGTTAKPTVKPGKDLKSIFGD